MAPLWTHSHWSWRNGWQLDCWTGVPVLALMWARKSPDEVDRAISRRFWSPQAGPTPRNRTGTWLPRVSGSHVVAPSTPYQPSPKPSPFVVSTPIRECMLWSIRECSGL
jgi:hypothetical protein